MKTLCPNCKQQYEVEDTFLGATGICEICKTEFMIEELIEKKGSKSSKTIHNNKDKTGVEKKKRTVHKKETNSIENAKKETKKSSKTKKDSLNDITNNQSVKKRKKVVDSFSSTKEKNSTSFGPRPQQPPSSHMNPTLAGCLCLVGLVILYLICSVIAMLLLGGHEGASFGAGGAMTVLLLLGLGAMATKDTLSSFCCFAVLAILCFVLYLIPSGSDSDYQEKKRDPMDPITWREEEKKDEARLGYDKAPYACRRCGMKSFTPLEGGMCLDCHNYLGY